MNSIATSVIVFICIFGGAILGMFLNPRLPAHHLGEDSKRTVNLGAGVIATMAALVLGLLVASAKSNYDSQNNELLDVSARVLLLNRLLARYGPDANTARQELRGVFAHAIHQRLPRDQFENFEEGTLEGVIERIQDLKPANDIQDMLKRQALSLAMNLGQTRWLIYEQMGTSVSVPLLVMLVFWMTINFVSLGLFAPRNATVLITLFLCAFAVSGAIFLILEMYRPFGGWIHMSSSPLRKALIEMAK